MIKRNLTRVSMILVLALLFGGNIKNSNSMVYASEVAANANEMSEAVEIPSRMQPLTEIEYIDSHAYIIHKGGEALEGMYNENGLTAEEQINADLRLQEALKELPEGSEIIKINNPSPMRGTYVYYDYDGCILKIVSPISLFYSPLPNGSTSPIGTYTWGSHSNVLTVTSTTVKGTGRITTFTDTIGERDNVLVKGDCATKGEKDNPAYNTIISVRIPNADTGVIESRTMYKRDNGDLPDAILDIWKDGVQMWNYTYVSWLSFDNTSYSYIR